MKTAPMITGEIRNPGDPEPHELVGQVRLSLGVLGQSLQIVRAASADVEAVGIQLRHAILQSLRQVRGRVLCAGSEP